MMKKYGVLKFALCMMMVVMLATIEPVSAAPANTAFKDDAFYKCIINTLNLNSVKGVNDRTTSHVATDEELALIGGISCDGTTGTKITDTTGIHKLTDLKILDLSDNLISSIDLSTLTKLIGLNLMENNLASIDLSNNILLETVALDDNNLSSLNVASNTALTILTVGYNNLTSIDLSNNTGLLTLVLEHNQLTNLNLSNNKALKNLMLNDNPFVATMIIVLGEESDLVSAVVLPNTITLTSASYLYNPTNGIIDVNADGYLKALALGTEVVSVDKRISIYPYTEAITVQVVESDGTDITNPQTGLFNQYTVIGGILLIGVAGYLVNQRKHLFPKA